MRVISSIKEIKKIISELKLLNKKIACVPTMGYLHDGHTSLIKSAKDRADIVVTTLFVNPTQFAPNEDYENYPRNEERDKQIAKNHGTDILFIPEVLEIYPIGYQTTIIVDKITQKFEGEKRPQHFDGVTTIVAKLFNIIQPDIAIFGQKDYQQTLVIRRMVKDLNFPIKIIIAPTIRESDGLAMSSRNKYLTLADREKSSILFLALENARHAIESGETNRIAINSIMIRTLRKVPEIKIDYAVATDAETFEEPEVFLPGETIVLLLACYLGKTRLIDNAIIKIPYQLGDNNFIEDKH